MDYPKRFTRYTEAVKLLNDDPMQKWSVLPLNPAEMKQFTETCKEAVDAFKEVASRAKKMSDTAGKRTSKPDGAMESIKTLLRNAMLLQGLFEACIAKKVDADNLYNHFTRSQPILEHAPPSIAFTTCKEWGKNLFHHSKNVGALAIMDLDSGLLSKCCVEASAVYNLNRELVETWLTKMTSEVAAGDADRADFTKDLDHILHSHTLTGDDKRDIGILFDFFDVSGPPLSAKEASAKIEAAKHDNTDTSMLRAVGDIHGFDRLQAELAGEESEQHKARKAHSVVKAAVDTVGSMFPDKPVPKPELDKASSRMMSCWRAIAEVDDEKTRSPWITQLQKVMVDFKKAVHIQLNLLVATILTETTTHEWDVCKSKCSKAVRQSAMYETRVKAAMAGLDAAPTLVQQEFAFFSSECEAMANVCSTLCDICEHIQDGSITIHGVTDFCLLDKHLSNAATVTSADDSSHLCCTKEKLTALRQKANVGNLGQEEASKKLAHVKAVCERMVGHILGTAVLTAADGVHTDAIKDVAREAATAWHEAGQHCQFTDTPALIKQHLATLQILLDCFNDNLFMTTMLVEKTPSAPVVVGVAQQNDALVSAFIAFERADKQEEMILALQWVFGDVSATAGEMIGLCTTFGKHLGNIMKEGRATAVKEVEEGMAKLNDQLFNLDVEQHNDAFYKYIQKRKAGEDLKTCHTKLRTTLGNNQSLLPSELAADVTAKLCASKNQTVLFAALKMIAMPKVESKGAGAIGRIALNKLFKAPHAIEFRTISRDVSVCVCVCIS